MKMHLPMYFSKFVGLKTFIHWTIIQRFFIIYPLIQLQECIHMYLWELTGFPFVPTEASSATTTSNNDGLQCASFFYNPKKCIHKVLRVGNYVFYESYAYCQQFIHIFKGKNIKFKQTHTNLALTATFPPRPYLLNFVTVLLAPVSWEVFFCVLHSSQYLTSVAH
jgi:hypothetical protein